MHFEEILKNLQKGHKYEVKERYLASKDKMLVWNHSTNEYVSCSLDDEDYHFIIHTNEWKEYIPEISQCPVCLERGLINRNSDKGFRVVCPNSRYCGMTGPMGVDPEDAVLLWGKLSFGKKTTTNDFNPIPLVG